MGKKQLINFHIHSTGSDGRLIPEEVVRAAIENKLDYICFTDHYIQPTGVDPAWDTHHFFSKEYVEEIARLKEKYKDKIDISFGAEFDWLEGHKDWTKKELKKYNFDYVMGSLHNIFYQGEYVGFECGKEGKPLFIQESKKFGGIQEFVSSYYQQVRNMINSKLFDCVGHFDIIKMYNADFSLFSEKSDWYRKEVIETLDMVAKSKMALEINVSGFRKTTGIQYPSLWILKEANKRKIPLTFGTDAHHNSEQLIQYLDKAHELAKQAGYDKIVRFKARKMIRMKI
jgi:histidinol-phosphatase (PHP family)